jgi:hypothetical protein
MYVRERERKKERERERKREREREREESVYLPGERVLAQGSGVHLQVKMPMGLMPLAQHVTSPFPYT